MIPQRVIEEVQAANDVVEVVSSYIPLKRAGRSFKACCPFHSEKTPSFFVNPEKQIWHCFGCNAGGGSVNFVMQYERVPFPEAVRILARKAGIEVPETRRGAAPERGKEALYRLNDFAASWFAQQLWKTAAGGKVLAYLRKRGVSDDLITEFSLGYAPDAWESFRRAARARGHAEESLLGLGLVMRREEGGRVYDRFRNRLMIPIRDAGGRVIAFSGRVVGDGTPKYMNSPESALFSKSRSLYGIHLAKRSIVEEGRAIVVEGYFDLLSLFAAGIRNVVASQGTAFTAEHARILRRFAPEVVMSFDAAAAGQGAALRSLDALLVEGLRVRVLVLPGKHDPDTFVREKGGEAFRPLVEKAADYFDFLLDDLCRRHDARREVGKARVAAEFLDALARVDDGILREAYRRKLAERLDVPQEFVIEALRKKGRPRAAAPAGRDAAAARLPAGERELARLMLDDPRVLAAAAEALTAEEFRDTSLRRIAECAFALHRDGRGAGRAQILAALADDPAAALLGRLAAEEEAAGDRLQVAHDCIRFLKRRALKEEIGRITREIARREKAGGDAGAIPEMQKLLMRRKTDLLRIS
ncbi:MAG: DNA primase [Candidatus Aureabacteria bacterium]|nr:DNA primase [Candidatus Auribacterota bacterium]